MSENDFLKIKEMAKDHKISPSPQVWDRLDGKLKSKRIKRRLRIYRNVSVAAVFLSVISVTFVMEMYITQYNPSMFSSNENFEPILIEELEQDEKYDFYSTKNIKELKEAYVSVGLLY